MRSRALALAMLAWAAVAPTADAQAAVTPLDRRITVRVKDVALRDALDRVAAAGSFKLSYSGDNIPLDRRVTVWRDTTEVREILAELLRPFSVTAVSLPDDQVVLAPRAPESRDTIAVATVLERVVVTGSVIGAHERALPVALDVVSGREMERRGQSTLSSVFDGSVPGVWLWEQAPTTMLAHYGSIRGASSFGASYPKVYIDGIEVANPLLLTQLTPERVERVEVIRGPQGAALYGSDAISGVVNIVSRQDAGAGDGARMLLRTEGGYSAGYATTAVQHHTLSARLGSNISGIGTSLGYSTSGAYIPEAYSREVRAAGTARFVGTKSTFTANLQFTGKNAGVPVSPLLGILNRSRKDSLPQSLRMYTIGATATRAPNEIWTLALTGGLDGYNLENVARETGLITSFVDTGLRASQSSALRATIRANAVARVGSPDDIGGTLTFAAERSMLNDRMLLAARHSSVGGTSADVGGFASVWNTNMGFTQQADIAFRKTAYVTAGFRQERVSAPSGQTQMRLLPMFGGALVRDFSGVTAKARFAYGKGIRMPHSAQRAFGPSKNRLPNPFLAPEEQSGVEAGVDLMFGERTGLHLTRFDQLAFGLIQEVMIGRDTVSGGPGKHTWWSQLQNVGEIANKGWEAQANAALGPFSLGGALTTVSSRVQRLSSAYASDLRVGDRVLGVPARTLTGTASYRRRGFQVSTTLSRAASWVNYDRLAIAQCIIADMANANDSTATGCADAEKLDEGAVLRKYWARYDGKTRVRASASFDLRRGMMLTLTGENLLNHQHGEPDSITIVPGRTLTAGIRARF
jgi:outer membrane receptor protein involved in Fe transport